MAELTSDSAAPKWPPIPEGHPLRLFASFMEQVLDETLYTKIWGIELKAPQDNPNVEEREDGLPPFHTLLVMQKFLRAYSGDFNMACWKLRDTLLWMKELQHFFSSQGPQGHLTPTPGYVTKIQVKSEEDREYQEKIVVFNLHAEQYVRKEKYFSVRRFVPWKIALMEQAVSQLSLATATIPIPDYDLYTTTVDPYTLIEICDFGHHVLPQSYNQIARSTIIADNLLRTAYPGFVERIYAVNVWRMHIPLLPKYSNVCTGGYVRFLGEGSNVASVLGENVPENYGGVGKPLNGGEAVPVRVARIRPMFNWQSFWTVADVHRDTHGLSVVDMSEERGIEDLSV
ncbi:hypothetical protein RUND412_002509 [Rhizina undulata]